jgi:hypothetical protein
MSNFQQIRMYNLIKRYTNIFQLSIYQITNILPTGTYIICYLNASQLSSIKFNRRLQVASTRQFSAYEVVLFHDESKAYTITHRAWPCCVNKYCFMQTHECRLKLDATGEHSSMVRVAIYVACL